MYKEIIKSHSEITYSESDRLLAGFDSIVVLFEVSLCSFKDGEIVVHEREWRISARRFAFCIQPNVVRVEFFVVLCGVL